MQLPAIQGCLWKETRLLAPTIAILVAIYWTEKNDYRSTILEDYIIVESNCTDQQLLNCLKISKDWNVLLFHSYAKVYEIRLTDEKVYNYSGRVEAKN